MLSKIHKLLIISSLSTPLLYGADLTVLNSNDSGKGSLRAILEIANSNSEPDNITFAKALEKETIVLTSSRLTISSEISLTGFPETLTISGNGERQIIEVTAEAVASISGLKFIDGISNRGAGIQTAGTLTVNDCVFRNHFSSVGSGIENSGLISVNNCRFEDNSATDDGAGFNNCFPGTGIIDRCSFSGNTIVNNGAALSNFSELTVTNSIFFDNSAINPDDDGSSGLPTMNGGAIFNGRILTLVNCTFFDNVSGESGGAIYNRGQSLTLINCTLSGNTSARGGAISSRSGVQLIQTTIANNIATISGGALFFQDFGNFQIANSIVANNSDPQILLSDNLGPNSFFLFGNGRNIFSDDSITNAPNFNNAFSFLTNTDPLLAPLKDNGGPVPTLALLPDSPAIDAGFNSEAVDSSFVTLEQDARGIPRILSTLPESSEETVDIGSFESTPTVALKIGISTSDEPVLMASGLPGTSYLLERSETLEFDPSSPVETFSLDQKGVFTFLDNPIAESNSNFYRLRIISSDF